MKAGRGKSTHSVCAAGGGQPSDSRRDFIAKSAALTGALVTGRCLPRPSNTVAATFGTVLPVAQSAALTSSPPNNKVPNAAIPRIRVIRRDETTLRLGGDGDCFHMSWTADDRQLVSLCDGTGWFNQLKGVYNSRLFSVTGEPSDATFREVPGYPELIPAPEDPRYYNFGTIALDGRIYQFLSTLNVGQTTDGVLPSNIRFIGAKLIYSPDNGRTWCNQDGSSPVRWEAWKDRSRDTLVFFNEDQDAFSIMSILQMGRGYADNKDGYVYVYAPNGSTEGRMNQLVMFRVPKTQLPNRARYEYFAGLLRSGQPLWTGDMDSRRVVHTFPNGWVNKSFHPWAWMPSVTYNAPLDLYMMASWGTGMAADGLWFGKPSYLGIWVSRNPWGPWEQIHEETSWIPAEQRAARAYAPQIAPKWIAKDGKSFWLVWTDFQVTDEAEDRRLQEEEKQLASHDEKMRRRQRWTRIHPYYSFNTQRVDLVLE